MNLSFKHSGNAGDIIYALPNIKYICEKNNCRAEVFIHLNQPSSFDEKSHPIGNVMMNQIMYDMLRPLLLQQDYIQNVEEYQPDVEIDYDLDKFRTDNKNLSAGNISKWIEVSYPELRGNLNEPSIKVPSVKNDYILVNRTSRYNNLFIDYTILDNENVWFIGTEKEFKQFTLHVKNIRHLVVDDFLQLAQYIAGCKLFIGNQSMPFAIAEQLKVKRILEQYIYAPNVIPQGGEYGIFHTQDQFKKLCQTMQILQS